MLTGERISSPGWKGRLDPIRRFQQGTKTMNLQVAGWSDSALGSSGRAFRSARSASHVPSGIDGTMAGASGGLCTAGCSTCRDSMPSRSSSRVEDSIESAPIARKSFWLPSRGHVNPDLSILNPNSDALNGWTTTPVWWKSGRGSMLGRSRKHKPGTADEVLGRRSYCDSRALAFSSSCWAIKPRT